MFVLQTKVFKSVLGSQVAKLFIKRQEIFFQTLNIGNICIGNLKLGGGLCTSDMLESPSKLLDGTRGSTVNDGQMIVAVSIDGPCTTCSVAPVFTILSLKTLFTNSGLNRFLLLPVFVL